jgi:hypothetical protein
MNRVDKPTFPTTPLPRIGKRNRNRSCSEPTPLSSGSAPPPDQTLAFELIPQAMHHKCARAVLPSDVWRLLRKITIESHGSRCAQCGSDEQLECHEVSDYASLPGPGGTQRHVMKLVGLRALCHLCHVGKHIGFAHTRPNTYEEVKSHLLTLYRLTEAAFAKLEQAALHQVAELNKVGPRALDLTYLNDERYVWVRHRFGREFTSDELSNCHYLDSPGIVS